MLSTTSKTAIKAVIFIASNDGRKFGIKEIALHINASEHSVGKMLQTLVKHRVILSLKGPNGGFYISKLQLQQPIIQIIEAIDGLEVFTECGMGLKKCSSLRPCPLHHEYKAARDIIENLFRTKQIWELCEPVNNGLAYLIA